MNREQIEQLYIISQDDSEANFKNNIELYTLFLFNSSRYAITGFDDKTYKIACTILKNYKLIDFEYSVSELLDRLLYAQEKVCWKISQSKETSIVDIDKILSEIKRYKEIKQIISDCLSDINDPINMNSINKYLKSDIFVYYLDSLTLILSKNYLIINNEYCNEIMNLIEKNGWLTDYLSGKVSNSMLNRDLVLKYIKRILTIKEFVTDEQIIDDALVESVISNKIKDQKLVKNLILELNPEKLISIFNYDMEKLMKFIINIDYADNEFKLNLIRSVFMKYIAEDNYIYLFYLMKSNLNENRLISKFFIKDIKNYLFKMAINDSLIDADLILYMLENNVYDENFISNSMNINGVRRFQIKNKLESLNIVKDEDYNAEIGNTDDYETIKTKVKKYNITGRIISYSVAMTYLNKYLKNEINLDVEFMKAIVRAVINHYLEEKNINNVGILFNNLNNANGFYNSNEGLKYISINIKQIEKFLSKEMANENKFDLFVTMFHEMRHAIQENNINNNDYNYDTYFMLKESIIKKYDSNYYELNYRTMLEEIDARRGGIDETYKFFFTNFPHIAHVVKNSLDKKLERYDYSEYSQKKFSISEKEEYVNAIFDKIISVHSNLLEEYPILQIEYNMDGSPKGINEFNFENNSELTNKIVVNRYGMDEIKGKKTI